MKFFLFIISFLYRSGVQIRNWLYERKIFNPKKAPLFLISVGNITFGGTEKTPLAMRLLSFLIQQGYRPALVSRGYKGKWEKKGGIVSDGKKTLAGWKEAGDEPYMVSLKVPQAAVLVGKNRFLSCMKAADLSFDVAVLDDGFQHRRLSRDLDIVLYDSAEKVGRREPFSSLKRADMILIKNEADKEKKKIADRFPEKPVFSYSVENRGMFSLGTNDKEPIEKLKGQKVIAFCGIARPERFLSLLQEMGVEPLFFFKFPDHHHHPLSSLKKIDNKCRELGAEAIVTTEKDAVKVAERREVLRFPVYYLRIDLRIGRDFYLKVTQFLQKRK
jgi:tetraacyldisaccharide 4'-kinase